MKTLQLQMNQLLQEYGDKILDAVDEVLPEVAKIAVDQLKQTSPERTGNYAKSWKASKKNRSGTYSEIRVYNEKFYRLTHLLEYGHASRNGGRVKAQPHIIWAEETAATELINRLEDKITEIK